MGAASFRFETAPALGDARSEDQPALIFPIDRTLIEVEHGVTSEELDRSSFMVLAPKQRYRVLPKSAVAQVLTVLPTEDAIEAVLAEYGAHLERALLEQDLASTQRLARTRWVDELANRYLFERRVCEKHDSAAARFLETELLKELYFFSRERPQQTERASVLHLGHPLVSEAVAWLEAHLFEPTPIAELARRFNSSESSLLRAFKRELGLSPAEYQRGRRLDEAMLLLKAGRYSVTEVATAVGYQNLAAFSVGFRKRFGRTPSAARGPAIKAVRW